jgi:UDP-glucose 4-epimerase
MSILVTGGSGFIGGRLLRVLGGSSSFDVVAGDVAQGDIRSYEDICAQLGGVDGIVHLAAISRVNDCEVSPYNCAEINILGTLNVIDAAVKNGVKWVMLVSTGEVNWIQNDSVKSFHRLDNLYGVSKISGELILDVYSAKHHLNSVVLRISSVVFGGVDDNQNKVLPIFVKRAIAGEPIVINNIASKWDFIHVDQLVHQMSESVRMMNGREADGSVLEINVSSGVELDLLSLAKIIHYLSKSSSKIECDGESRVKVTEREYMEVIENNGVDEQFIASMSNVVSEYRKQYHP